MMRGGIEAPDFHGPAVSGDSGVDFAAVDQRNAEIVMGLRVIGLDRNGPVICRDCFIQFPLSGEGIAQVV